MTALPAADSEALRVCELAPLSGFAESDPEERVALTADSTWFIMEQEKNTPSERFLEAVKARLAGDVIKPDVPVIMASAATLRPLCGQRWPASQRSQVVKLPQEAFERATVCSMAAAVVGGMARSADATLAKQMSKAIISRAEPLLSKEQLSAHGITIQPGSTLVAANWLKGAHRIGNLNAVMAACAKV
ncbi:MAG: hypothetical protein ACKOOL_01770 [Novosphingobium sp.]